MGADRLLFTRGALLGRVPCCAEFVVQQKLPHHSVGDINSCSPSQHLGSCSLRRCSPSGWKGDQALARVPNLDEVGRNSDFHIHVQTVMECHASPLPGLSGFCQNRAKGCFWAGTSAVSILRAGQRRAEKAGGGRWDARGHQASAQSPQRRHKDLDGIEGSIRRKLPVSLQQRRFSLHVK